MTQNNPLFFPTTRRRIFNTSSEEMSRNCKNIVINLSLYLTSRLVFVAESWIFRPLDCQSDMQKQRYSLPLFSSIITNIGYSTPRRSASESSILPAAPCWFPLLLLWITVVALPLQARAKSSQESYGGGLNVSVPATEQQLLQAVRDTVADGTIQGTKEYNKDEYISGPERLTAPLYFPSGPDQDKFSTKSARTHSIPETLKTVVIPALWRSVMSSSTQTINTPSFKSMPSL